MPKSVDPDQTAPIGAVCSGSTMFASILNLSVMLGNNLQQTTFSDAFFSWGYKGKILIELSASKQWRPLADAAFCGVWSGSALFAYVPQKGC